MLFNQDTMEVGGKISLPDSVVAQTVGLVEGTITQVNKFNIHVDYPTDKNATGKITAIYSYVWLNGMYGDPAEGATGDLNDRIPF